MFCRTLGLTILLALCLALGAIPQAQSQQDPAKASADDKDTRTWTDRFPVEPGELVSSGRNRFFILEPGYQMVFKKGGEELIKTVLTETKKVGEVETRVVEEKESKNGQVFEISRNFYAISKRTSSVYYFGEEVDFYENGKIVNHEGAWLSGVNGARFGLMMPGLPLMGGRYYQESAPKVALDRSEIVSLSETVETPAGIFKNCLKTEESTPLEPGVKEYKYFAAGIGLVKDQHLELIKYGFVDGKK